MNKSIHVVVKIPSLKVKTKLKWLNKYDKWFYKGCVIGKHVYDGEDYEYDKPLMGYVETKVKNDETINNQIYALDCEMVGWFFV